ncbi:MAG: glutamate--tRNA ligase, partial [Candidatus Thiodiazotropha lotti]
YLVRLGWSHGDQEIFSIDEMIELFDIDGVNKAASSFNTEKLLWLNQHYIKQDDAKRIAHLLSPHMGDLGIDPAQGPDLTKVAEAHQERARTLVEMAEMSAFCYQDYDEFEEKAAKKHLRGVAREPLQRMRDALSELEDWQEAALHGVVEQVSEALELKMGKVAQPLRVAVVGRAASPGIDTTLYLVGKEACLRRIDKALDYITQREAAAG